MSEGGGAASSTLNYCTLTGNTAGFGGATQGGTLNDCLVISNSATTGGGGAAGGTLNNCTLIGNSAPTGGGMYGSALFNCIAYFNQASSGANYYIPYNGGSLSYCCTSPLPSGPANFTNPPALEDLANGDFHLQSDSPCINSGNNAYATTSTDLDGSPRIQGGTVDIGAYEFPASVLKLLALSNSTSGLTLTWQSVSGKTYFLQRSTNLTLQPAFSSLQSNLVGLPNTTSFTDTNAKGAGPYFYRVGVQ